VDRREVRIEGNICHAQPDGKQRVLIGLRFSGIDHSDEARENFMFYLDRVGEYQQRQPAAAR